MKLTAQNLEEILEVAKEAVKENYYCFNYQINGYDIYVSRDEFDEDNWFVEPNKIDENGCSEPIEDWSYIIEYGNFDQLIETCKDMAERYFEEV